jgi:hypothetical protein
MLLEGLTTHWGFYFTSRTSDGFGSLDLSELLDELNSSMDLRDLPPTKPERTLQKNVVHTHQEFAKLLFARVLVMTVFLRRLYAETDVITDEHREQWLLIQLAPGTLLGTDIFSWITNQFTNLTMSFKELRNEIFSLSLDIKTMSHLTLRDMICVIDEAQHASHMLTTKFRSSDGHPRPVLREQLIAFGKCMRHILVSGTGLSMANIERIINSTTAKELKIQYEVFTRTGAFDNLADQKRYLEQYFPSGYFDTENGKVLLSRIGYWLHGRYASSTSFFKQMLIMISRYRFTAAYLSRIIATGFQSPHRTLNEFVLDMANYEPLDAIQLTEEEPLVDVPSTASLGFDGRKLSEGAGVSDYLVRIHSEALMNRSWTSSKNCQSYF